MYYYRIFPIKSNLSTGFQRLRFWNIARQPLMEKLVHASIILQETSDPLCPWKFNYDNKEYGLRLNDFPGDRPLYTVLDSKREEVSNLEGIPQTWQRNISSKNK